MAITFRTQKQIQYQLVINIKEIKDLCLLQLNIEYKITGRYEMKYKRPDISSTNRLSLSLAKSQL
jgi:hypothetical protein